LLYFIRGFFGAEGPPLLDCSIVNTCPPTVTWPVRDDDPLFDATANPMLVVPLPVALATVTQDTLLVALQGHSLGVFRVNSPVAAFLENVALVGDTA
jgi:hypothetical protein